ncbi:Pentatricopeptide repeat-containing protein [Nymphaea thermarum]|nr:Pentatricopeptide repeat-containing protein [Nymphaea thermarum]
MPSGRGCKLTLNFTILESLLQSCRTLAQFKQIYSQMITCGLINDTYASSRLLRTCLSSEFRVAVDCPRRIFDNIKHPNVVMWNTMMKIYVSESRPECAILLYKSMLRGHSPADNFTFPILIQACTLRARAEEGEQLHNHVVKLGFGSDAYVGNTLIHMYSVCEYLDDSRKVFDGMPQRDSVSWNAMLAGYVGQGWVDEALFLFEMLPCRSVVAWNSMITMMGRQGLVLDARRLFDDMQERDVVSWSAMISCYEQNGAPTEAVELFGRMNHEGVMVDGVTMVTVVSACAQLMALKEGEGIHGLVVRKGFVSYTSLRNALLHMYARCGHVEIARKMFGEGTGFDLISWNSLITGYAKAGYLNDAKKLFDAMPERDIVSWSAMISGYAQHNHFRETLSLFREMQLHCVMADDVTLVSVLSACAHLCALEQGSRIHAYVEKKNIEVDVILGTTLVDMYMKCGCVDHALKIFSEMQNRGTSSWNAIILGMAMNGHVQEAFSFFDDMTQYGVAPNEITFIGILSACRHAGLVSEGRHYFQSMTKMHQIVPNVKHYGCMVDLLGRAGFLKEAEDLISSMPMTPDIATWGALLGACKIHRNLDIGVRTAIQLLSLDPCHDGAHVLLSNIYALRGSWDNVNQVRSTMKRLRVLKEPGCSWIETDGVVHQFVAGDRAHPQSEEIERMLNEMAKRLRAEGYEPDTSQVSLDVDEEDKGSLLYMHSEKIAIAFGLININKPLPIRIAKNLRICCDCHIVAKLVSRTLEREIVVRDRHRFHHFKQGLCSCSDYW